MKRPRDMVTARKKGWNYRQPETGATFTAGHPRTLESKVFQYRLAQGNMDVSGGWQARLWHDVCLQDEAIDCEDKEDKGKWPNLADIWNFVQTMVDWKMKGGTLVDQTEAERRANICLSGANGEPCPHNRNSSLCLGCKGIAYELQKLVEDRKTPFDDRLHVCDSCGCTLKTKIWFPKESLHVDQDKLPTFCWQRDGTEPS